MEFHQSHVAGLITAAIPRYSCKSHIITLINTQWSFIVAFPVGSGLFNRCFISHTRALKKLSAHQDLEIRNAYKYDCVEFTGPYTLCAGRSMCLKSPSAPWPCKEETPKASGLPRANYPCYRNVDSGCIARAIRQKIHVRSSQLLWQR